MLPPIPHLPALPPHPIAASIALMPRLSRLLGLAGLITATLGASWTAPSLAGEKLTQARIANLRNQVNLLNADRSSQPAQLQDLCTGQNPGNTYYTRVLGDQPQMLSLQGFGAMLITFLSGT
ncbi:MAG: hypothetical protein ACO4CG_13085 [Prochlorothrix sp.]